MCLSVCISNDVQKYVTWDRIDKTHERRKSDFKAIFRREWEKKVDRVMADEFQTSKPRSFPLNNDHLRHEWNVTTRIINLINITKIDQPWNPKNPTSIRFLLSQRILSDFLFSKVCRRCKPIAYVIYIPWRPHKMSDYSNLLFIYFNLW